MRRTLRVPLGAAAALAAVGVWEWAAGPTVVPLPGADPDGCYVCCPVVDPTGRFLDVYQSGRRPKFWVYEAPARVSGPWDTPARTNYLAFDAAGQLRLCSHNDPLKAEPFVVRRLTPGGGAEVVWERPDALGVRPLDTPGGPAAAVLSGGPGRPLRAELIDLMTGQVRRRLDFPGRLGPVASLPTDVAAGGWAVSDDGRRLALAEGWAGNARVGPPGVEVWDFEAGTLAGRVAGPDPPADQGACDLRLSADGREVWLRAGRRAPAAGLTPLVDAQGRADPEGWDWAAGRRLPAPPPPPDPAATAVTHTADGLTLWERTDAGGRLAVRVTDADGGPTAGWVGIAADRLQSSPTAFVPGGSGAVVAGETDAPGWADRVRQQVGLPPGGGRLDLTWLDWEAGRTRPLRGYRFAAAGGSVDAAGTAGAAVAVVADYAAGRAWLEVWPAPPQPAPPPWLWPVAAVAGGLAGWAPRRRPAADTTPVRP